LLLPKKVKRLFVNKEVQNVARVIVTIPEPKEEYDVSNQRQILEALDTLKNQLNFSFQTDFKNEQDAFNFFLS